MQEMQETWVWSLGWEDSLEESMAIHSSIFAWRIPWTEEPGRLQSIGLQRVGHDWNDLAHMHDVWETIAVVLQLQNENPAVDIHEAVANVPFSSFLLLSCVRLCDPRDCSMPSFRVHPNSRSLFELMSIVSVMPSNHLILCCPLLPPSIFPSIRIFSNESVLHIRWPKDWSFSFSINPSNEYSGLISFRIDWLDLRAVQGTLKSSPTPQFRTLDSNI